MPPVHARMIEPGSGTSTAARVRPDGGSAAQQSEKAPSSSPICLIPLNLDIGRIVTWDTHSLIGTSRIIYLPCSTPN